MSGQEINTQVESNEEVQLSPVEQQAMDAGWVPKETYMSREGAEEHKWVDAGEFLRRGELFRKIEDQSKQLKDVRAALQEMKKLNGQIREVEYKRALETLREQKKQALVDGDADAVLAAEERIDLVKEQVKLLKEEPVQVDNGQEHPEFVAWTEQNSWYKTSEPMKAFADALGRDLARSGKSPSEVLRQVAAEVRKEFPHKFKNPNQDKPGAVETGRRAGTSSASAFKLTDDERRVMNQLIRTKVFENEQEYIEQLKKVR